MKRAQELNVVVWGKITSLDGNVELCPLGFAASAHVCGGFDWENGDSKDAVSTADMIISGYCNGNHFEYHGVHSIVIYSISSDLPVHTKRIICVSQDGEIKETHRSKIDLAVVSDALRNREKGKTEGINTVEKEFIVPSD